MTHSLSRPLAAALCGAALAACAGSRPPAPAPAAAAAARDSAASDDGAFLVRLGSDTLAGERFTRAGGSLSGSGVVRSPATIQRTFSATLNPDGTVARFELAARRAAGTVPPQRVVMTFGAGSVSVSTQVGDSTPRVSSLPLAGPGVPYVGNSFSLFELATRLARRSTRPGTDTARIAMVASFGRVLPATVTRLGADSMLIAINDDAPYRARVDAEGRILGLEGTPTQRVAVTRLPSLDVTALQAERPIGTLSPTDTVESRFGRAALSVVYSRPSRRGRTILGGIVPYDAVWRTGANAATVLTTSAPLNVGGVNVPRGSYSLWTVPSRSGWKLVINRQSGQWGTEYDASRDLARIDMIATRAATPVEQFTITLTPTGTGTGRLGLAWDDFAASVPVAVVGR
jgi:hypothetical protein